MEQKPNETELLLRITHKYERNEPLDEPIHLWNSDFIEKVRKIMKYEHSFVLFSDERWDMLQISSKCSLINNLFHRNRESLFYNE